MPCSFERTRPNSLSRYLCVIVAFAFLCGMTSPGIGGVVSITIEESKSSESEEECEGEVEEGLTTNPRRFRLYHSTRKVIPAPRDHHSTQTRQTLGRVVRGHRLLNDVMAPLVC